MTQPKWQQTIHEHLKPEQALAFIEGIEGLLQDDRLDVLKQITSDLLITQREIRAVPQRLLQECSPDLKNTPLLTFELEGQPRLLTLAEVSQLLMDRIAENRQLLDLLMYYLMALEEQSSDATP